ncbi:unnamed protein product, partial [Sphacelaria rigidula]
FTWQWKQREHIVLRCLHCTLPASLSHPTAQNTYTRAQDTQHFNNADSADCLYTRDQVPFHDFDCLFSIESLKIRLDPIRQQFHSPFFSIGKKCAKTRPQSFGH